MLKREIPGWLAGACLLLSVALAAPAQANLTLAQIAPMSGPIAEEGRAYNLGIRVAIEAQNARGGLHGQKLDLRTLDDQYKPELMVELIRKEAVGKTLAELNVRGLTGATVLAVTRQDGAVTIPTAHEVLREGDRLALAGTREAVEAAQRLLGAQT